DIVYEDLAERINRLANSLLDLGVRAGDRVAYLGNNHPSFIESLFAVSLIGAIFVPINTRLAPPEVQFVLEDSGSKTLIFNEDLAELAREGSRGNAVERRIVIGG